METPTSYCHFFGSHAINDHKSIYHFIISSKKYFGFSMNLNIKKILYLGQEIQNKSSKCWQIEYLCPSGHTSLKCERNDCDTYDMMNMIQVTAVPGRVESKMLEPDKNNGSYTSILRMNLLYQTILI